MSNKQNNSHSLLDAQSNYPDEQKSIQETKNSSGFSNFRYVIPAQRSTMAFNGTVSTSTTSVIPMWRRNVQVTPPNPQTPTALVQRATAPSAPFRPMDTVRGASPRFTAEEKIRAGFSWRYRGDINNPKNSSAGISPEENCALFLTNLPAGTTEKILLDALGIHAPFGRVHATSIAPATDNRHSTACAKLAMFGREEAVRVFDFVNAGDLRIAGRTIGIAWNNNRSPIQTDIADTASRVLEIHGPREVVDIHRLSRFFEDNLKYQTQDITVLNEDKEERLIRWAFCSFRAQGAESRVAWTPYPLGY